MPRPTEDIPSAPPTVPHRTRHTPGRLAVNLIGFGVGLGLFIWIVVRAVTGGDWGRLAAAGAGPLALLLACSVVRGVVGGATFWITEQPLVRTRFLDLQILNVICAMLNYAPLRIGTITRGAYHVRVDGVAFLSMAGWFTYVTYMMGLAVGACVMATLLRPELDWIWLMLTIAQMILGAWFVRTLVSHPAVARHAQHVDRIVEDDAALWGTLGLRIIDIAVYTVRLTVAMHILGVALPSRADVVLLAGVALTASVIPFGRLGFRESAVALFAQRLDVTGAHAEAAWAQLALIESMSEALIFIPLGGAALPWLRARWRSSQPAPDATVPA